MSWNRSEKFQENQVNFNIKLYDTKQDTEPSLVIYIGKTYLESKHRPRYCIAETTEDV